jgi:hypothetical protein
MKYPNTEEGSKAAGEIWHSGGFGTVERYSGSNGCWGPSVGVRGKMVAFIASEKASKWMLRQPL